MTEMSSELAIPHFNIPTGQSLVIIKANKLCKKVSTNVLPNSNLPEINICNESHMSLDNRMDPSIPIVESNKSDESETIQHNKEYKTLKYGNELYVGDVLLNNLHGRGFFWSQKKGEKIFYDGLYYVNKLEGYSQVFYDNGTYFQGLFKQHKRYGPGVLTYLDGTEDVGFWDGFSLARLGCVIGSDLVPRLATTILGKTKLLCYRYLVPLFDDKDDFLRNIFRSVGESEEILQRSDEVLNLTIRNPNSLFFHKNFFDQHFFGGKDCTIKVALDDKDVLDELEEKELNDDEDDVLDQIEKLRSIIREIDESLQPFQVIKESLLKKINFCETCCTPKECKFKLSELAQPERQESPDTLPYLEEVMPLDLTSLKPDLYYNDPSLPSDDITQEDFEEAFPVISEKSSRDQIIEFCICAEHEKIEDLQQLEDELLNITHQETFYTNIKENLEKKVSNIIARENKKFEEPQPRCKQVEVTELWAWNNEELLMEMQKHCFKHRSSEDMVSFDIPNLILGNRKNFGEIGKHEEVCHKFLTACSKDRRNFVRRCLRENINSNVCDARGNSGIFFAAAQDQLEIISILTNSGAKLDQINDEELTPLSMSILKYLSIKYNYDSWEKAFLPETQRCSVPNLPKWYDIQSFLSLSSASSYESMDRQSSQLDFSNSRIIQLFERLSDLQQNNRSLIRTVPNASYVLDLTYKESDSSETQNEAQNDGQVQNQLKVTHLTIITLLDYGADPNAAVVPYPPLVLSLFTENPALVTQLLEAKADANVLVTDDKLSCIHVIASLPCSENNVQICRILVAFKCDPNLKTEPTHWAGNKSYFTGMIPQDFYFEDFGKNALHLLCMRKDFENDEFDYFGAMCKILIRGHIDCTETYLGHTALSMAVLSGNIRLAKYLIRLNVFDPYEDLPYYMGNILTLFSLKRFENTLPTEKCKAMLTALFECDVNVLNKVGDTENAIQFAEEDDALYNMQFSENDGKNIGKGKVKPSAKPKKANKSSQSTVIKEFLKDLGRNTIIKQVQMLASEILFEFSEENILEDKEIAVTLAEFLTPPLAVDNLELLVQLKIIDHTRVNKVTLKNLLDFVNLHKKIVKVKKPTKAPKGKKEKDLMMEAPAEEPIDDLLDLANFKKSAFVQISSKTFVCKPGLDDPAKYKVCFHCLRGSNKELKTCPRCQMIRFCSAQCNKLNLKVKTLHTCNIVFYDMTIEQKQDIAKGESLLQLAKSAKENCRQRLHEARKLKLYQEELKILEMWRADTYGTKFLKYKPLFQETSKKRGGKDLTFNLTGLTNLLERNFRKNPAEFEYCSLECLLDKVKSQKEKMETRHSARTTQSFGYSIVSRFGSVFSDFLVNDLKDFKEHKKDKSTCTCKYSEKMKLAKHKQRDKSGRQKKQMCRDSKHLDAMKPQYINETSLPSQFETLLADYSVRDATKPIKKKLKKIPPKYKNFIEIMGTYFPDMDMSFWLLPYACCSNGQLYYKFCDNEIFRESYSLT